MPRSICSSRSCEHRAAGRPAPPHLVPGAARARNGPARFLFLKAASAPMRGEHVMRRRQALLQHREKRHRASHSLALAVLLQTGDASPLIFDQLLQTAQAPPFLQEIRFRHRLALRSRPHQARRWFRPAQRSRHRAIAYLKFVGFAPSVLQLLFPAREHQGARRTRAEQTRRTNRSERRAPSAWRQGRGDQDRDGAQAAPIVRDRRHSARRLPPLVSPHRTPERT